MPEPDRRRAERRRAPSACTDHPNESIGRRELQGIPDEVSDNLFQAHRIRVHPNRVGGDLDTPFDVLARRQRGHTGPHDVGQIDSLLGQHNLAGDHSADVEQIVDKMRHVEHLPLNHVTGMNGARFVGAW